MKTTSMKRPGGRLMAAAALALVGAATTATAVSASTEPADDTSAADTGSNGSAASDDSTAGGDSAASGYTPTCETALDEDDSVDSLGELDFSGITINVGSKDFAEQFVLGQLLIVGLEAGGADVTDSTNLGGTVVNRDALLAGEIDAYFDYNGTGWATFLGNEDVSSDPIELTDLVCNADLEQNNVRWIGTSPFNNTYGFATGPDFLNEAGEPFDMQGMADYLAENSDAIVCLETEFPNRPDGLVLFEEATGFVIPQDQIEILETGVIYEETANGNCDFGEIFTTDGRIPALELNVVQDPGVMIIYNASLTMLDETFQQAPEAFEALADTILAPLDDDTMAELIRQNQVDGVDAREVAERFLTEQGLLGDGAAEDTSTDES
jgi:osmoprotectant transport system substrate-binding protein